MGATRREPMDFEMPQRPEFFMGGGALFSTPRNYMALPWRCNFLVTPPG
jgi:hypothetical protein